MSYDVVRLLHIAFAALWLASIITELLAPLHLTTRLSESLHLLKKRSRRAGLFGAASGIGTILSGSALLSIIGAHDNSWALNAGMSGALIMAFIGACLVSRCYRKAIASILQTSDLSGALRWLSHSRVWSLLTLLLWLGSFFLMGFSRFI